MQLPTAGVATVQGEPKLCPAADAVLLVAGGFTQQRLECAKAGWLMIVQEDDSATLHITAAFLLFDGR